MASQMNTKTGVGTMSEEARDRFEIPKEMRSMAEASVDQARKAFEKFVASVQQTAGSIEERGATVRAGAKDVSAKAISYAEQNVQASLDFAEKLLHAKDLTEVMRLHSEYVQSQMRALAEQASEMGQIVSKAAMEAAKPNIRKRSEKTQDPKKSKV
jgi:phasin